MPVSPTRATESASLTSAGDLCAKPGLSRNGRVVAAHAVRDDESIISITSDGLMVRQRVVDITVVGRGGMGVRLVRLTEGAQLVSVSVVAAEPEEAAASPEGQEGDLQ